jgi:hypothetical protein
MSDPVVPRRSRKALVVAITLLLFISPWIFTWSVRREITRACEPNNPAIQVVAAVIRRKSTNPLQEVALIQVAADGLLDYDLSSRVYGEGVPTVSQMLARRRSAHWLFPHGDCKEHAVIAGSLLAALGISWEPVVSFTLRHAWVRVRVPGGEWDIMAIPPQTLGWLSPTQFRLLSILAGGSGIPLRTPSTKFTEKIVDRLVVDSITGRVAAPEWGLHDAAALGLVIETPQGVYGHASVNLASSDQRPSIERDARNHARTAGFPLGEPL